MEEDLHAEIEQFFELGDPYIAAESYTHKRNMPGRHRRENMHKNLDGAARREQDAIIVSLSDSYIIIHHVGKVVKDALFLS